MRLIELSDASAFLARAQNFLLRDERCNNMILSNAIVLARAAAPRTPKLSFFVVEGSAGIECAALNATDKRLLVSTCSSSAAEILAAGLDERGATIGGVFGPESAVTAFLKVSSAPASATATTVDDHLLLSLEKSSFAFAELPLATGETRLATAGDWPTILRWSRQYIDECGVDEPLDETAGTVRKCMDSGNLYVWSDGEPVAMGGFGGFTPNGARIQMVYTEPSARSQGYARSLVGALSRTALGDREFCALFVSVTNVPALRAYERIGYRQVGAFSESRVSTTA